MIYGYGIDLGQSLNYSAIVVTKIDKNVRLVGIRKYKKLVKENLILYHPTSYGPQYALNPQRIQEIINILGDKTDEK